ncbi:hypothetical protein, conserved [Babesia bigemina]|uniref:RING-type E3 ubiquitin transferase n=1 Tax=Babesia bigemina TaxID=5866 RepID=A0A061CZY0_BABBI|nr:hypothetical protein, conserved [Babesia bigemina]CDR93973.1 hypothetical protein, conserved [Babesia bigemina]|eukprot:XP_012766159.1 hypothetical protein, conserved [Babesia bigemina]
MVEPLVWPTPPPEAVTEANREYAESSSRDSVTDQSENDASPSETQRRTFNLFHYINYPPLRNSIAQPEGNPEDPEFRRMVSNRNYLIRILVYIHLCSALIVCGLMVLTVVGYEIRMYEEQRHPSHCLILFWLIRTLLNVCLNVWSIRYHILHMSRRRVFNCCRKIYDLGSIVWVGFAVYYNMIYPRENLWSASCRLCFFMIWLTIASYITPIMAFDLFSLILCPVVFCALRYREQGSLSPGLPRKLLAKLDVDKFENVAERIKRGETKAAYPGNTPAETPCTDNTGDTAVSISSDEAEHTEEVSDTRTHRSEATNAMTVLDRLCAICIMEIDDREKIYVMPCDIRHLFHRDCLKKWFKRSRICPICRINVADIIRNDREKQLLFTTVS